MTATKPLSARRAATRRIFLRLCGSALGVGVAIPLEAKYIEPYALETTRHEVFLPDLPLALDGITVAHLTDLHRGPVTPDAVIEDAIRVTKAANPDLIALTGDFVAANQADAQVLAKMLAPLTPRLGMWGCLGNHDYNDSADNVSRFISEGANVRMLRNTGAEIAPGFWISGIEDTLCGKPDAQAATHAIPENAAALFLTHNPVGIWNVSGRHWLALSGHTHGGQVLVPGLPVPLPPGMAGFPLASGWGIFDKAQLYVSRGVGMAMFPLRFRCRPEVAFMVLRRGDAPPRQLPGLTGRALRKVERVTRKAAHSLRG